MQWMWAWKLRNDERVICMEKTNFRYTVREDIEDVLDFASADVSFISLSKILPPARALLKEDGEMVCLIKPQFEAGREKVGKKGVVRDAHIHREVIEKVLDFAAEAGFDILHLTFSPVKGPEGNIEYLVHLGRRAEIRNNSLQGIEVTKRDDDKLQSETAEERCDGDVQDSAVAEAVIDCAYIAHIVSQAHRALDQGRTDSI